MGQQRPDAGLAGLAGLVAALDGTGQLGAGRAKRVRARARPTEVLKMAKATVVQRVKESVGSMAHHRIPMD